MMQTVFDKFWFQKHQSKLLWLANSWIGKYIFQFKKMGHYLNNKIVKITPNSVAEFISINGEEIKLREHFFSRNEYAKKLYFVLLPIWYAMHIWDWFMADHFKLAPQLSFGFDTLTQYPGSIGTNNPADGVPYRQVNNSTWVSIHDSAGNVVTNTKTNDEFVNIATGSTSGWLQIKRSIFCFDTSALTSSATISAVVMSLYGVSKADAANITPNVNIYLATPAATNILATTDYQQIGTTAQCDTAITYSGFSTTGYNDFTFNATGRGNVSKTGISKFGARNAQYDAANSEPAGATLGAKESLFVCYFSENGSNMPKLVVTYTLGGGATKNFLTLLGVT